jgi:hypothetical protein
MMESRVSQLQRYRLPDGVLPLCPQRQPFSTYAAGALSAAVEQATRWPEKRGMMSRAVREISGSKPSIPNTPSFTIEAHVDAVELSSAQKNELVMLGFELDGFATFNPSHFSFHYTLKFKLSIPNSRRPQFMLFTKRQCEAALSMLSKCGVEAYIELEVYPSSNRRFWPAPAVQPNEAEFPLQTGSLVAILLPRSQREADDCAVSLDLTKRADLHIKLSGARLGGGGDILLDKMCQAGFYNVITWAGNSVCTAQFAKASECRQVFRTLDRFFSVAGGAREMTLETISSVWRKRHGGSTADLG